MGYGTYDTPRGLAGYCIEDVCHQDGCDEQIDRGLAYLCGGQPGYDGEFGCGWWFCGSHLYAGYDEPELEGVSQCKACLEEYEAEHPDVVRRDEEEWARRVAQIAARRTATPDVGAQS